MAQWLSFRFEFEELQVPDSTEELHCVLEHFILCLILASPRRQICPDMTEVVLAGKLSIKHKEIFSCICQLYE